MSANANIPRFTGRATPANLPRGNRNFNFPWLSKKQVKSFSTESIEGHSLFYKYAYSLMYDEKKLVDRAIAPGANQNEVMVESELQRKRKIIRLYESFLEQIDTIEKNNARGVFDSEIFKMAAETFNAISKIEGNVAPNGRFTNAQLFSNYRKSHQNNNNINKRVEDQIDARCGIHALNHVFQEEKLYCGEIEEEENEEEENEEEENEQEENEQEENEQEENEEENEEETEEEKFAELYIDAETKAPLPYENNLLLKKTTLLNVSAICRLYKNVEIVPGMPMYSDEDLCVDNCDYIPISILQNVITDTAFVPGIGLPNTSLGYVTSGIEFRKTLVQRNSGKIIDKKESFNAIEKHILIEQLKLILQEDDTIGALLRMEGPPRHYTAIINKHGFTDCPPGTDFTYIDSIDEPCSFDSGKSVKNDFAFLIDDVGGKLVTTKDGKPVKDIRINPKSTGNYTYKALNGLMEKLLDNNDNFINITVVKFKRDGSSYFSRSLENILTKTVEGGRRKTRKQARKMKASRTRRR